MSKVLKSDLTNDSLGILNTSLSNEISDTENLINTISKLIDGATDTLTGEGYNQVRNKLSTYITVLNERKKIAISLQEAISNSIGKMNSFMDTYPELDTSKLTEVENKIQQLEGNISSITNDFNEGEYNDEDDNSNVTLSSLIGGYQTNLEEEKKLKEKLTELASIDKQAFSPLEEIESDIENYATKASEITESTIN